MFYTVLLPNDVLHTDSPAFNCTLASGLRGLAVLVEGDDLGAVAREVARDLRVEEVRLAQVRLWLPVPEDAAVSAGSLQKQQ